MSKRNIGDELIVALGEAVDFQRGYTKGSTVKFRDPDPNALKFSELQAAHVSRSPRWHDGDVRQWSVLEIAGEMCGEAGEAANVAKKLLRLELGGGRGNAHAEHAITERDQLVDKLKREIGDTIICLAKLAEAGGVQLDDCVRTAFNTKSEQMGFPERL